MSRISSKRLRGRNRSQNLAAVRPALDSLEQRELMAYSPFGFSRPDLVVEGFAAPVGSYGAEVSVVLDVRNLGTSSIREPLAFFDSRATSDPTVARYQSTADADASNVRVYLSSSSKFSKATAVPIGTIAIPAIRQNTLERILPEEGLPPNIVIPDTNPAAINTAPSVVIPDRSDLPDGFPAQGKAYLFFEVDSGDAVAEHDETNNINRKAVPIKLVASKGQFEAVGLDVPRGMAPGDLINPNLKVINYGTIDIAPGQLEVGLVQSNDNKVDGNDTTIAAYQIASVQPITKAPTKKLSAGLRNLDDPANVTTILASSTNPVNPTGPSVRLPNGLQGYKFGAVVDPAKKVNELGEPNKVPSNRITQFRKVGNPLRGVGPVNQVALPSNRPLNFPRRNLPI